jgi:hypothetical protein
MARGSKPGERRGGRQKGTPNKLTMAAREAIEQAAETLGGAERLAQWAKEKPVNERAFWTTIYPKLLPLQLTGKDDAPLIPEVTDEQRIKALEVFFAKHSLGLPK